ncbi:MAG: NADPH-dependent FMN reductase [Thermoproteota archaeon]
MNKRIKILGFTGSLRKNSYNRALLENASELLPSEAMLEVFDLTGIPVFNQDLEAEMPSVVLGFKSRIKTSNAILIATPEYNHSIPGVLKNAIDWASRPYGDNSFEGKPVAVMSASPGMLGGVRAQIHLKQILQALDMHIVNKPEVILSFASKKIDEKGKLIDETARKLIGELLKNLIDLAKTL